jgi:hypothetical protein
VNGIKKGTPCKSGAVPAAVSPNCKLCNCVVELQATFSGKTELGRHQQQGQARRPAINSNDMNLSFGIKSLRNIANIFHQLSKAP